MISIELNWNWKDVLGSIRASKETFQPRVRNMFSAVESKNSGKGTEGHI